MRRGTRLGMQQACQLAEKGRQQAALLGQARSDPYIERCAYYARQLSLFAEYAAEVIPSPSGDAEDSDSDVPW